jgi:hypothetical protein
MSSARGRWREYCVNAGWGGRASMGWGGFLHECALGWSRIDARFNLVPGVVCRNAVPCCMDLSAAATDGWIMTFYWCVFNGEWPDVHSMNAELCARSFLL